MEFAIFVVIMVVVAIVSAATKQRGANGTPSPRVQKLIERIQAQQGGNQPIQFQGQFTQPGPQQSQVSGSQQAGAALQALMQAGRQHAHPGEWANPGQPSQPQFAPPQQYQPTYQPPATWLPTYQPPQPNHQQRGPQPKPNLDARVREQMKAGNEVGAVRLLSDELDLGLLEAQAYARNLVAPAAAKPSATASKPAVEEETRYVGSAAFSESLFALDEEENTWASGWVDTPEPDDRSDIDELWQTVRNPPRPTGAQ